MLDEMDVKILRILQQDCTRPVADIGKQANSGAAGNFHGRAAHCFNRACVNADRHAGGRW